MALKEDLPKLIDLAYFKRRTWLQAAKRASYLLPVLAAGVWLAVVQRSEQRGAYSKGPLSRVHAPLSDRCEACHPQSAEWRSVRRFVEGEGTSLAALNQACLVCHKDSVAAEASSGVARHAQGAAASGVPEEPVACASCHAEHEGAARLSEVEDATCARCHADLSAHRPAGLAKHVRPEGEKIPSMAEHAADFVALAKPDPSHLTFNHAAHLRAPVTGPEGARVAVACEDCHRDRPTPGRFGRVAPHEVAADAVEHEKRAALESPVRYAFHCAGCHPLMVDERLAGDATIFPGGVPHEAPSLVRAWIRGQLLAYADQAPGAARVAPRSPPRLALVAPAPPAAPVPAAPVTGSNTPAARLSLVKPREREPRHPSGALLDDERPPADLAARSAWVERSVAAIESRLYASPGGACVTCHPAPGGAVSLPLEPAPRPAVPSRWLVSGRFDHARHEQVECAQCHRFKRGDGTLANAAESVSATDVLLAPGIAGCRSCHAAPPSGELARAPSRCTTCHRYHRTPDALGKEPR